MVIPTARRSWPMAGASRSSAINSSSYDVKTSKRSRAKSLARFTVIWVIVRPPALAYKPLSNAQSNTSGTRTFVHDNMTPSASFAPYAGDSAPRSGAFGIRHDARSHRRGCVPSAGRRRRFPPGRNGAASSRAGPWRGPGSATRLGGSPARRGPTAVRHGPPAACATASMTCSTERPSPAPTLTASKAPAGQVGLQRRDVGRGQVGDVDIVAQAGAVGRIEISPKTVSGLPSPSAAAIASGIRWVSGSCASPIGRRDRRRRR